MQKEDMLKVLVMKVTKNLQIEFFIHVLVNSVTNLKKFFF